MRTLLSSKKIRFTGTLLGVFAILIGINLIWLVPAISTFNTESSILMFEAVKRVKSELSLHLEKAVENLQITAENITISTDNAGHLFGRTLKRNSGLRSIALAGLDGLEYLRVERLKLVTAKDYKNHSNDDYFKNALGGNLSIGQVFITDNFEPHVAIAVPVVRAGKVKSVIIGTFNIRNLTAIVRTAGITDGRIYVVDREGFQILHPDVTEVLKQNNFKERKVVQEVILHKQNVSEFSKKYAFENMDGKPSLAVGVFMPTTGWGVFAERTRDSLAAMPKKFSALAALIALGGTALSALLIKSTGRLKSLNKKLEELLKENFESAKFLVRKDRELSTTNQKLTVLMQELESTGRILIKRDVELSMANTRLAGLDVVKSEFVSVAAHQLRTPLTGIRWSLQAILDGDLGQISAEQQRALSDSLTVTLNAVELINDLLDTARMEEGRFGFKLERQSLIPIAQKVLNIVMPRAEKKNVSLSHSFEKQLPDLDLDEDKISIVLDNLLNNSIKYTPPGGAISFTIRKHPKEVEVSVSDTGIGIPKEQQQQVFTQFFRASNAKLFAPSGTGLGLYMVKNIVENHGGKTSFTSAEGEGTTVKFTIPIKKP